jgi:biopolymer transport protein ExbD
MPLQAGVSESEPLNMTPMIDVVFNLLVFFLLSATYLSDDRQLELSVPSVRSASPSAAAPLDLEILVHRDGRVELQGRPMNAAELENALAAARANYPDQAVSIRGDGAARHQWIADVLSICQRVGVRKINVVVRQQE